MRRAIHPRLLLFIVLSYAILLLLLHTPLVACFFVIFSPFSLPRLTQMFPRDTNTVVDIVNI